MRSFDMQKDKQIQLMKDAQTAVAEGRMEEGAELFAEYQQTVTDQIMAEANAIADRHDAAVLQSRGVRQLTSQERKYYEGVIDALGQKNYRAAMSDLETTIPETVYNAVFEDLRGEYPILNALSFQFFPANVKIVRNVGTRNKAQWGKLCDEITKEVAQGLTEYETGKYKLSAYVFLCKSMLTLGAEWIDRYVREVLFDALAFGLEDGCVNGTGVDEPIGLIRNLAGPVDPTDGYPAKTPVALNSFGHEDLGPIMQSLAVAGNGRPRKVGEVIFLYNPSDWYTTVYPAAFLLGPTGYINVVPYPIKFIECESVEAGKAVIGIGKNYLGTVAGNKEGEIEFSDDYKFLEDDRTYLIKLLGNGEPTDNTSFVYLDIAALKPFVPVVKTITDEVVNEG